jgi:4-diphosphocytidyl-2-C-methyl-D-erythritol kinase
MRLRVLAPAKVNLHLAVGAAGSDGYHPVETVLQTLALHDRVELAPGGPSFLCEPDLGLPAADNLAWRAARAMAERFHRSLEVAIAVEKRIPSGAGLGGASSDAAAVIVGLATYWGIDRADVRLSVIARSLGADVPFFLEGGAALFGGRGDVLTRRARSLEAPIVVVKPSEAVPTARAYEAFDRLDPVVSPKVSDLMHALDEGDAGAVAGRLHNAMTASSVGLVPAIGAALEMVRSAAGVLGAAMAGSGSAVFGICASGDAAEACAAHASELGYWSAATRTRPAGCEIEAF